MTISIQDAETAVVMGGFIYTLDPETNTTIMLQERAKNDPEFAAAWANQKAFVAQGMTWRTMSRLP